RTIELRTFESNLELRINELRTVESNLELRTIELRTVESNLELRTTHFFPSRTEPNLVRFEVRLGFKLELEPNLTIQYIYIYKQNGAQLSTFLSSNLKFRTSNLVPRTELRTSNLEPSNFEPSNRTSNLEPSNFEPSNRTSNLE